MATSRAIAIGRLTPEPPRRSSVTLTRWIPYVTESEPPQYSETEEFSLDDGATWSSRYPLKDQLSAAAHVRPIGSTWTPAEAPRCGPCCDGCGRDIKDTPTRSLEGGTSPGDPMLCSACRAGEMIAALTADLRLKIQETDARIAREHRLAAEQAEQQAWAMRQARQACEEAASSSIARRLREWLRGRPS